MNKDTYFYLFTSILAIFLSGIMITAYSMKVDSETELVSLMRGMEIPYKVFDGLSGKNQQIFIKNGGKISNE